MSKLVLRIGATVATLFAAGAVSKLVSTQAQLTMNSVAIDQLRDSDSAFLQFNMFQWLMQSNVGSAGLAVLVIAVLFFIWKGQFKNV